MVGEHCAWWDQYKGDYEHWRFGDGFVRGWEDAYALLASAQPGHAVPEIGMKGAWAKVRVDEHAREKARVRGCGSLVSVIYGGSCPCLR